MSEFLIRPSEYWVHAAILALASGIPFIFYFLSASSDGYWLDGGEFVAASINLGITHPPGQPLYALIGRLFAMVPLGPIAFRVALFSSLAAAFAAGALCRAIALTVHRIGVTDVWLSAPLALGATWFVAGSYGWWFQAVRPEVYALQAALTCFTLERVMTFEASWPNRDLRPLITAALTFGLALSNHHFLALAMIPALLPTAGRALRIAEWRSIWLAVAAVCLGLFCYVYLPLRASAKPQPNLGDPTSLDRLLWVVSAKAFHKNAGTSLAQPVAERFADVTALLVDHFYFMLPIALLGLYLMLRSSAMRRFGVLWGLLLLVSVAARAWLGFSLGNPDALGYLMPAFAAIGTLFAACLAELVATRGHAHTQVASVAAAALCYAVPLLGLAQFHHARPKVNLAEFSAVGSVDALSRMTLPPSALLIAHAPQTVFAFWGAEAQDMLRPDLALLPMPFIAYPGMLDSLEQSAPEARELLRIYAQKGSLSQSELETTAASRPTFVELDPRLSPALYRSLSPSGLFYETLAGGTTETDERYGARQQRDVYRRLYSRLEGQCWEPATKEVLLWHHFNDALYYLGFGDRQGARAAIYLGKRLQPAAIQLDAMERALEKAPAKGPIDVEPFRQSVLK
jgi:hypothetical protein